MIQFREKITYNKIYIDLLFIFKKERERELEILRCNENKRYINKKIIFLKH